MPRRAGLVRGVGFSSSGSDSASGSGSATAFLGLPRGVLVFLGVGCFSSAEGLGDASFFWALPRPLALGLEAGFSSSSDAASSVCWGLACYLQVGKAMIKKGYLGSLFRDTLAETGRAGTVHFDILWIVSIRFA